MGQQSLHGQGWLTYGPPATDNDSALVKAISVVWNSRTKINLSTTLSKEARKGRKDMMKQGTHYHNCLLLVITPIHHDN